MKQRTAGYGASPPTPDRQPGQTLSWCHPTSSWLFALTGRHLPVSAPTLAARLRASWPDGQQSGVATVRDPRGQARKVVAKLVATAHAQRRIRADGSGGHNAVTCGYGFQRTSQDADFFPDTEEVTGSSPVSPTTENPSSAGFSSFPGESTELRATVCARSPKDTPVALGHKRPRLTTSTFS